jgi:hypothetical protein
MARINDIYRTRTSYFDKLMEDAWSVGETNDCAVKAICVVTGAEYADAHTRLAARGRKKGHGTYMFDTHAVIRDLGFKLERMSPGEFQKKYPRSKTGGYVYKQLTTHHVDLYPEAWNDGHAYLIHTSGHVAGALCGKLHDWTRGRAKRIECFYRVTKV